MAHIEHNMSLTGEAPKRLSLIQKVATGLGWTGIFFLFLSILNVPLPGYFLWLSLGLIAAGVVIFANDQYRGKPAGIKNDGVWFKNMTSRGVFAWGTGILLTLFYIVLYWYPQYLGYNPDGENTGIVALFDPLSNFISGNDASQWFVYGTLYTLAILAFGYKFLLKYRHNKYEKIRTFSVMFFQLGFAFLIPEILIRLNQPYYNPNVVWPLNYDLFAGYKLNEFFSAGTVGMIMLGFGLASIFLITPILTYFYGKRWYCSWVCGCGGLAETAGDPYRHLSDKSRKSWMLERWLIHTILVLVVIMTTAVVYSFLNENPGKYWLTKDAFLIGVAGFLTLLFAGIMIFKRKELAKDAKYGAVGYFVIILAIIALYYSTGYSYGHLLREWYGFFIGAAFSGVIGVGFYPIFGNRVWCRFGCPMAAVLGMQQRLFSRFRITTNGGQCISCGNCSTYCEMGIDVRSYAQKGENIVRSSCVGCGICSAVCPRGVLKLENGPREGRINGDAVLLGNDVDLLDLIQQQKKATRKL
ncbi:4Fe-4S binding domain-containing protein [Salinimicrobium catena]|uniref:4Fe-4S binding domain-containing protein n=1 Tax=Salinimicrobium catena TaxID=390640 RepID=A0A1H5JWK9_9FLAO|nr:4Fe-4S dicluster domain-containing protein [Salinimicrobium catena]SDK91001.1 4Fe-4S binding domain-containing protein [Salinimicrobium catena]SEE56657.1 4Fe-4S binding domain-containing protein [Salinimicrobium catena]